MAKRRRRRKKSTGGRTLHKAYSYKNRKGKRVTVKAHYEKHR